MYESIFYVFSFLSGISLSLLADRIRKCVFTVAQAAAAFPFSFVPESGIAWHVPLFFEFQI